MKLFKKALIFTINCCLYISLNAANESNLQQINDHKAVSFDGIQVKAILFPIKEATISSNISSHVLKYNFKVGESFKKGDLLLDIDSLIFKHQLAKAEATSFEASKGEEFWRNRIRKEKAMYKDGVSDKEKIENAVLQHESSKAKLAVSKSNLQLAQIDLNACVINAPFSGRLVEKIVRDYEHFKTGQPIMTIIDDNKLLAVMHLPSSLRTTIKEGSPIAFIIDETKTKHTGKVYAISAKIDPRSRTFETRVVIDNKLGLLSAGMSAVLIEQEYTVFEPQNADSIVKVNTSK